MKSPRWTAPSAIRPALQAPSTSASIALASPASPASKSSNRALTPGREAGEVALDQREKRPGTPPRTAWVWVATPAREARRNRPLEVARKERADAGTAEACPGNRGNRRVGGQPHHHGRRRVVERVGVHAEADATRVS